MFSDASQDNEIGLRIEITLIHAGTSVQIMSSQT